MQDICRWSGCDTTMPPILEILSQKREERSRREPVPNRREPVPNRIHVFMCSLVLPLEVPLDVPINVLPNGGSLIARTSRLMGGKLRIG